MADFTLSESLIFICFAHSFIEGIGLGLDLDLEKKLVDWWMDFFYDFDDLYDLDVLDS